MIRLVIALGIACALLTGYTLLQRETISTLGTSLKAATERAVKAEAKVQLIQGKVKQANAAAATARYNLKEALDANPVWRDTPVPVPVRDRLCDTLRCREPSDVPAPPG